MVKQSWKKKKKRGGRRPPATDHTSVAVERLAEELTALRAIYQEDCNLISGDQMKIKLRPYSQDSGYKDLDVSAHLSIRFLDGYPYKCPKLQIELEKGLSKSDADNLLSLLYNQANLYARKGQVMINKLVEAAQKFLSEVALFEQPHLPGETVAVSSDRPFVYVFLDLFIGSNSDVFLAGDNKLNKVLTSTAKLNSLEEENGCTDSHTSESEESDENFSIGEENPLAEEDAEEESDSDESKNEHSRSASASSVDDHHIMSHAEEKDLILAHLLRLACSSKGPLADALTDVASELASLGIVSDRVADLATESSSLFDKSFNQAFGHHTVASRISQFWERVSDTKGQHTSPASSSRYQNDFEDLKPLGHGGFGRVVLCKNKLDGRQYAVKRIRLEDNSQPLDDRILREVAALSRLQHRHVVRYHQAWFETGDAGCFGKATKAAASSSSSFSDQSSTEDNNFGTYLYIQMEYCPRKTLKQTFKSYELDKNLAWHMFRQIVEGLAHIHGQGIIHRDLKPNNIFFDARNDIKIGDFGLAKFLKLEQLEQDLDPAETTGVSVTDAGQYGIYEYKAPEIVNKWPKINEKVDIYSLGIIFFELWHPFRSGAERVHILLALKEKGEVPSDWATEFPEQALLLHCMLSSSPSDRPSATELLKHAFPPRMESELLDNILRTMHNSEDTSIYDKVVGAVFSEEIINTKKQESEVKEISSIQHTDLDSEIRDLVSEVSSTVFRLHCAKRLEIVPMCLLGDSLQLNRNAVKFLSDGGDMIELCHELRLPFINWVVLNQKSSFKRFEICNVYRRPIGHSPPNRYLQGDFDVIGGASALTEAEVIKAAMDVIAQFFHPESCDIHVNHGDLLEAVWSWIGIKDDQRKKVAELLSLLGSLRPQSTERKSMWVVIRRQLRQELNITEGVLNKLQSVGLSLCGIADYALPRLRGALQSCVNTLAMKSLEELTEILMYLRIWKIGKNVFIDPIIPPTESYHRDFFFQIHLRKHNSVGTPTEGTLLAVGGRYDSLLHQMWQSKHKSNPPGAVGTSLALETIIQHSSVDICRPLSNNSSKSVLVCSRGGGGLLEQRIQLVSELWDHGIKAEFVPIVDPSPKEQYDYAKEHDIKCLIEMSEGSVKIRHLELKREKEVSRESLVNFFSEAMAYQFRNSSIWN